MHLSILYVVILFIQLQLYKGKFFMLFIASSDRYFFYVDL
jgi:hypothetical protein